MKAAVTYGYTFTPATRLLNLSNIPGFDARKLFAVINITRKKLIYAVATPGLGYSALTGGGTILTLDFDTTSHNGSDLLQIIYDDNFQVLNVSVQNEIIASVGRYLANDPSLTDGDSFRLRVNSKGELIVEKGAVVIANLSDIEFPAVQPVIGDRVNNESVSQFAIPTQVPSKVTVIGGLFDSNNEIRPARVDDDGSQFVKPGTTFPVDLNQMNGSPLTQGRKPAASSIPMVMSNEDILDNFISGFGPATAPVGTNLLLAVSGTGSIDCQQYRSIAFQINAAAATTVVTVFFEGSNDNVNFVPVSMFDKASPTAAPVTQYNTAANVNRFWEGPVYFRYFRARISTGITAGSARGFTLLRMAPFTNPFQFVGQGSSLATVSNVTTVGTVATVTAANLAAALATIIASAAITTTATSAGISTLNVQAASFQVAVTAVSGTTPTLDISIEETKDGGTNWYKIYDFERITATGTYRSPQIAFEGTQYRIVRAVAGTTPSFTMSMTANTRATVLSNTKRIINRTIDLNTLNSVTPTFEVRGTDTIQFTLFSAAGASTPPVLTAQGSDGNDEWYDLPATLTGLASTNVTAIIAAHSCAFARLKVSTAGVGAVLKFVSITAQS